MGPLLWAGRFVDFGSFHEAIRIDTDKPEIIFRFQFTLPKNSEPTKSNQPSAALLEELDMLLTLKVFADTLQGMTRTKECIAPLRATAERYYRIQDFAVDEVDSQGRNLAMFLRNLTDEERHQFAAWTEKYFAIEVQSVGGQFSLKLKECGGNTAFNIADIGFGFCQVLPILMELWRILSRSPHASLNSKPFRFHQIPENSSPVRQQVIFAIEQPELHLHPRLQALLADALLSAMSAARSVNLELRLVIETHSETIINRLGHRIDNGDVKRQDINIVVFEKEHANAPAQIRVAEYDDEGFLTNWPFGFFEPEMI